MPGFVCRHVDFWQDIILQDHPLRCTLASYLREGVGLHDLLLKEYRGQSTDRPYSVGRFPGAKTRIRPAFASFVDAEVQALVDRGSWWCRKVGGRPGPREAATAPFTQGAGGKRDKTPLGLRREAVKQAVQEDPVFRLIRGRGWLALPHKGVS